MKKCLLPLLTVLFALPVVAQKVDSIYFHLYTDSLKRGQYNYINIDGKMSNGRWMPLTAREIEFSCKEARFEGNQLIIGEDFSLPKVTIRAVLKANPSVVLERTVWIKTVPDGPLPTREDMDANTRPKKSKRY